MYLLIGILPVSLVVVLILHVIVFSRKIKWLSWIVLFLVSGGLVALLGAGGLHAGLTGLLTFTIGFFWIKLLHKEKEDMKCE